MPLTLAVAGLTSAEKAALVSAIKAKASGLSTAWTLYWEAAEFPAEPDGLLYCPKREEGRRWAEKLKNSSSLLLAALPPLESTPSEVPLFVRMPFKPQDIVDTLNIAAKRLLARAPEESSAAPQLAKEERVDIQVVARGASRVDPLVLMLYAIFQGSEQSRFYKIRQAQSTDGTPLEILCWPDLELYWSRFTEEEILAKSEAKFEVYNCQGKREALGLKANELRHSGQLLWHAGTRAFKTAEILPWFAPEHKMTLTRWPNLPKEARTIPLIRIFSRLTNSDATFAELLTELKIGRKDLSCIINGLIMNGDLAKANKDPRPTAPAAIASDDPEQTLFLRALALRCADALERSIENLNKSE